MTHSAHIQTPCIKCGETCCRCWRLICKKSNALGAIQTLGVLSVAIVTGALTVVLWRAGHSFASLLCLVVHGNVCSLFSSALHELAHGTVFESRWLNKSFSALFGFLNWMSPKTFMETHVSHHKHTLHDDDMERPGSCRKLWFGTWVWSSFFNLPRFVVSVWKTPVIALAHLVLAAVFYAVGMWELIVVVTLATFWFGWLELLVNYPQHAGLPLGGDIRETTRSLKLPLWLSFLNWRMEYHLEHHLHPSVPCYNLPKLRKSLVVELPPQETLWQAWSFILAKRKTKGLCGA